MKTFNKDNFFTNSFAIFKLVDNNLIENKKPDFISHKNKLVEDENTYERNLIKTDEVSSEYYYTEDGVYRNSDHWGKCSSCFWILTENDEDSASRIIMNYSNSDYRNKFYTGFCKWEDFFLIEQKETKSLLEGEYYLAIEFNECFITSKLDNSRPIFQHHNHKSDEVNVVVGIELEKNESEELVNEVYSGNLSQNKAFTLFLSGYSAKDIKTVDTYDYITKIVLKNDVVIVIEKELKNRKRQSIPFNYNYHLFLKYFELSSLPNKNNFQLLKSFYLAFPEQKENGLEEIWLKRNMA